MANTNYIGCLVKILENPKPKVVNIKDKKKTLKTKCRVLLPQIRKKRTLAIVTVTFWGKLARDVLNYYKVGDYILIEGYLSLLKRKNKKSKKIVITVLKAYPLVLPSNRADRKI